MGSFGIWHWLIVILVAFGFRGLYCAAAQRMPALFVLLVVVWPLASIYGIYRCFKTLPPKQITTLP